tara:strand:+ start:14106 stop:14246 length:141 start_codon:yes stop_codon:yes gene_type:complete
MRVGDEITNYVIEGMKTISISMQWICHYVCVQLKDAGVVMEKETPR